MDSNKIGKMGEKNACAFLKKNGYKILKRNYRKKYGEVDIIAKKQNLISFFEVKTRDNTEYGLACEAVTKSKQEKIIKTAQTFILENRLDGDFTFDIIEIYHKNGNIQKIEHIENAFF